MMCSNYTAVGKECSGIFLSSLLRHFRIQMYRPSIPNIWITRWGFTTTPREVYLSEINMFCSDQHRLGHSKTSAALQSRATGQAGKLLVDDVVLFELFLILFHVIDVNGHSDRFGLQQVYNYRHCTLFIL